MPISILIICKFEEKDAFAFLFPSIPLVRANKNELDKLVLPQELTLHYYREPCTVSIKDFHVLKVAPSMLSKYVTHKVLARSRESSVEPPRDRS